MKILILPMGGIGNMLMFTPVLEKLKKIYPKVAITMLMAEDSAKYVLKYCPYVKLIIAPISINLALSLRKTGFDICLIPYPSAGVKKILFAKLSGCKRIISHPYFIFGKKTDFLISDKTQEKKQHDINSNFDLLAHLKIFPQGKDKQMNLWLSSKEFKFSEVFFKENKLNGKIAGIHLGSRMGMDYKRWSIAKFNKLIAYLTSKNYKVLVFFGSEEEFLMNQTYKNDKVIFVTKTTLHQTASLIKKCTIFISNDSGLMHVAVSQNVPTIGIFGPTIYWRTAPYGSRNITLKSNLSCVPCYNPYKKFTCNHPKCLDKITLNNVKSAILRIENGNKSIRKGR